MGRYRSVVKKVWTLATASNFINRLVGIVRTRIFPWKRSDMAGDPLKKGRYTEYSNKIGLFDKNNKQFIENSPEVVLSFPFKDAVLEAGMTKEDAGREERFLNIKIDAKDIDTLEDPKVLTNFKYIDKDGEKELDENSDIEFFDEKGELKQNLLIKGNNLLALYTLKENLAGKIKLIYIDPPYNTGNDGFKYNDNFNHSSWLTFMKNRLEAAKELLSSDGSIWIQCDDNEQAYLKVLCDETFGYDNFVNCISVNMSNMSGQKVNNAINGKKFPKIKEYILLYAKNKDYLSLDIPKSQKEEWDAEYNKIIPEWQKEDDSLFDTDINFANEKIKHYHVESLVDYCRREGIDLTDEWKFNNAYRIFATKPNKSLLVIAKRQEYNSDAFFIKNASGDNKLIICDFNRNTDTARLELVSARSNGSSYLGDVWTDISTVGGVAQEGGVVLKNGKKPEKLLSRIIECASRKNDIVLDYHLGSGTTAAVAHKMNRRWIGVEQMDYIETHAARRLKFVVNGEQSGVSQSVNWHGGGSFVYCELKKYNQDFIDRIMEAITIPELEEIYEDMQKNAFLKFFFDKNEFEKDENFRSKNLDERKQLLVDILDENQFYLNLSEMNDTKYKVTDAERVLTEKFYQIKKDEVEDDEE